MIPSHLPGKRGFTLIELMVVIAIIGLLSSIILASLTNARVKARDARRVSDLHQITVALELYYNDNGYYPPVTGCPNGTGWDYNCYDYSYDSTSWGGLRAALAPYISLPVDPINSACVPWSNVPGPCYSYAYGNVGKNGDPSFNPQAVVQYDLSARLENSPESSCGTKNYNYYFNKAPWCVAFGGTYNNDMYEASVN